MELAVKRQKIGASFGQILRTSEIKCGIRSLIESVAGRREANEQSASSTLSLPSSSIKDFLKAKLQQQKERKKETHSAPFAIGMGAD